jgi:hypothetical protein
MKQPNLQVRVQTGACGERQTSCEATARLNHARQTVCPLHWHTKEHAIQHPFLCQARRTHRQYCQNERGACCVAVDAPTQARQAAHAALCVCNTAHVEAVSLREEKPASQHDKTTATTTPPNTCRHRVTKPHSMGVSLARARARTCCHPNAVRETPQGRQHRGLSAHASARTHTHANAALIELAHTPERAIRTAPTPRSAPEAREEPAAAGAALPLLPRLLLVTC